MVDEATGSLLGPRREDLTHDNKAAQTIGSHKRRRTSRAATGEYTQYDIYSSGIDKSAAVYSIELEAFGCWLLQADIGCGNAVIHTHAWEANASRTINRFFFSI